MTKKEIYQSQEIGILEKQIYIWLKDYQQDNCTQLADKSTISIRYSDIAKSLFICNLSVIKNMKLLIKKGFVKKIKNGGIKKTKGSGSHCNLYELLK